MSDIPWESIDDLEFWLWKSRKYEDSDFRKCILVMGESTCSSDNGPELYVRQRRDLGADGAGWFAHYGV